MILLSQKIEGGKVEGKSRGDIHIFEESLFSESSGIGKFGDCER